MKPLRVALADDSSFIRRAVARLLASEPSIAVVGLAASGEELLEHLDEWQPEAIVLDLSMPGMGGLRTLDAVRQRGGCAVLILSTHSRKDAPLTVEALHRGAADFIDKQQYSLVDFDALRGVLVEKLHEITSREVPLPAPEGLRAVAAKAEEEPLASAAPGAIELVAIGASAGGPPAIEKILADFGAAAPVPIAVVQHMPAAFTRSFAERLNAYLPLRVKEAAHDEALSPGVVYIAPGGIHLRIESAHGRLRAVLSAFPEDALHRPSVDELFDSAARATRGRMVAVLLTGMGLDGAAAMVHLARAGIHTIAQDRASSAVFGMPRAAIEAGGAQEVLALEDIGPRLLELFATGER
ncbi:MAG: chemotaxis-specific protein-glutamate methyltransferase CheB [Acidobacteriota bacterium]